MPMWFYWKISPNIQRIETNAMEVSNVKHGDYS